MFYAKSKVYKNNRIYIPSKVRKQFNLESGDIIDWIWDGNSKITLNFRKANLKDDCSLD